MNAHAFVSLVLQDAAALVIVKATVVLALATAAALAGKRFSATRRHLLWLAALSSCVWLVPSSPVVPAMIIHTPMLSPAMIAAEGSAPDIAIPKLSQVAVTRPEPAQHTLETSRSSSAVVGQRAASPVVHPAFSGKWRQDTVAGPMVDFVVTDSSIIKQSASSVSREAHGHVLIAPTYDEFQSITFDGVESRGVSATGHVAANFIASAGWAGDTLVLTTRSMPAAHDVRSIERMSPSPDGNTLFTTISSFVDWKSRRGGPRTFVLRRVTPWRFARQRIAYRFLCHVSVL
jgi:hypothetical protein